MEKQFFCYQKSQDGVLNVSYSSARDLLLKHLNKNGINYYCGGSDGNSFQLYYRLRNTDFRIRQSIVVGTTTYRCTTSIVGRSADSEEGRLKILQWVNLTNRNLGRKAFMYDDGDHPFKYINGMSHGNGNGILNVHNLSEHFDQLIGQSHYMLDIEYADFLLGVLK